MTNWARAQGRASPSGLRAVAGALLAGQALLAGYVLWRSALLTPYSDEIDWIQRWRAFRRSGEWAAYLFEPVNQHRLPMIFGLIDFDIRTFGGTNWPLVLSGAAALAALACMLGREAAKAAPPPLALPGAALAVMLALMGGNVLDAATPICVNYVHGAALAVLALILAEGGAEPGLSRRRLAGLAAAALAGYGDAAALAVWPVLALGALRRREGVWLAVVTAAGAAVLGVYGWGQGAAARGSLAGALADPFGVVRLALTVLTLPWARANVGLAWIGGGAIAVAGVAGVALRGGRRAPPSDRVAAALILFSLGVAAMAGLGRTTADPLNAPLRYGVLMTPMHAGFLMLALPYAGAFWRANRSAAQALCVGVLLLATAHNALMAAAAIRTHDAIRTLLAQFHAGARPPLASVIVHPDLAHAERTYADLRRDGLYSRQLNLNPPPAPR